MINNLLQIELITANLIGNTVAEAVAKPYNTITGTLRTTLNKTENVELSTKIPRER